MGSATGVFASIAATDLAEAHCFDAGGPQRERGNGQHPLCPGGPAFVCVCWSCCEPQNAREKL